MNDIDSLKLGERRPIASNSGGGGGENCLHFPLPPPQVPASLVQPGLVWPIPVQLQLNNDAKKCHELMTLQTQGPRQKCHTSLRCQTAARGQQSSSALRRRLRRRNAASLTPIRFIPVARGGPSRPELPTSATQYRLVAAAPPQSPRWPAARVTHKTKTQPRRHGINTTILAVFAARGRAGK